MTEQRRNPNQRRVIDDIIVERERQRSEFSEEADKHRSLEAWAGIITIWLGKALMETPLYLGRAANRRLFRARLVKIAAICVAALEATDGNSPDLEPDIGDVGDTEDS